MRFHLAGFGCGNLPGRGFYFARGTARFIPVFVLHLQKVFQFPNQIVAFIEHFARKRFAQPYNGIPDNTAGKTVYPVAFSFAFPAQVWFKHPFHRLVKPDVLC
ncbi:hypothetical protein HMPREF3293_00647 [Christensenella minuta]|jgi:hypothetical protein|uniref:Uncharacterized protein n=1 Tax=Christensenella minuta TaxID=626937 RepID=A0A136Q7P2_9FIRM|nr:hypothetical protein HMPREF3293_00647 [Christensenella minuta]